MRDHQFSQTSNIYYSSRIQSDLVSELTTCCVYNKGSHEKKIYKCGRGAALPAVSTLQHDT